MRKKLMVPYGVGEPPDWVEAVLPPDAGLVLDAGLTWSDTGDGLLLVTTIGVLAVDPESGDMAGIRWEHFDPPLQLSDRETYATLNFVVQGCGAINFGIERQLAGNIWALAYQFRALDDGDVVDGVIVAGREPPPDEASAAFDPGATVRVDDALPPPPDLAPVVDLTGAPAPSWDHDAVAAGDQPLRQRRRWLRVGSGAG